MKTYFGMAFKDYDNLFEFRSKVDMSGIATFPFQSLSIFIFLQMSYFETFLKAMAVSVVVTPTIC